MRWTTNLLLFVGVAFLGGAAYWRLQPKPQRVESAPRTETAAPLKSAKVAVASAIPTTAVRTETTGDGGDDTTVEDDVLDETSDDGSEDETVAHDTVPTIEEALADPDINPTGRDLSAQATKDLAAFIRPRNVPVVMLTRERDALLVKLFEVKESKGEYDTIRVEEPSTFVREIDVPNEPLRWVSIAPGESAALDELNRRIHESVANARREIAEKLAEL